MNSILVLLFCVALVNCDTISIFGTGLDTNGNALPGGSSDPHWTLDSTPSSTSSSNAIVVSSDPWGYPQHSNARWISASANGNGPFPVGNFVYSTTFDLTNFDPSSASVSGIMAADDNVVSVNLNGNPTGASCSSCYSSGTAFAINSGFIAGVNTLTFVTYNGGGPAGFQTSLSGTANPSAAAFCSQDADQADWTPYGQGYYCWNGNAGFIQCWGEAPYIQAVYQNCAAGTSCRCSFGAECSNHGTETPCI